MLELTAHAFRDRQPDAAVSRLFLERWSPRAFASRPVDDETLRSLFEAARWAPSCYNEQPWRFVFADREPEFAAFRDALGTFNQEWAAHAPVLAFLAARLAFERNGKPNRWAEMDCGAAWMGLALQARILGLAAHAMAGFDEERAHDATGIPRETHRVLCAIAIGWPGDAASLPPALAEREAPSERRSLARIAERGRFTP